MRELWKKTAILASVGFALGVLLGLVILSLIGIREYQEQQGVGQLTFYLLASGAAVVYSFERWGLLKTTLTHFCISMASVCAVGFSVGWLRLRDARTWLTLAACVAAYFVIWIIMYLRYKREIRRINRALERWKRAQKDE